jgi:hypothetical protein
MKKVTLKWQPNKIVGMAHPGCCRQDGGCGKKH